MSKFKFRMEQILNIKKQLENSIKNELANALRIIEKEKEELKNLQNQQKEYIKGIKESMLNGTNVQRLREFNVFIASLETRINNQKKVVNDVEIVADKIREKLVQIVKEKKILELLKDKRLQEYKLSEQRKNELTLGEVASYKYIKRKVGEADGNYRKY